MAEVRLSIGGRAHVVACRDGGEAALEALGRRLDEHAAVAARAAGGQGGERTMLYIALMLADELAEAEQAARAAPVPAPAPAPAPAPPPVPAPVPAPGVSPDVLDRIAERLEHVADTLEQAAANA